MMKPTPEMIAAACEVFSKAYSVYPDGRGKTQITDWFELEAEDAVDFGVLKSPKWSLHSDIRSDEYSDYVAAVIKEPMREAITAALSAGNAAIEERDKRIADLEEKAQDADQLRRLFDQQWKRTREAGELWREAHPGNDSVRPDLGKLVKWLMDRAEASETRAASLEVRIAELRKQRDEWNDMAAELKGLVEEWQARAASLEAMVVEAGKALEPFSDIATTEEEVGRDDPDDDRVMVVQAHGCQLAELLVDHFRAARSIAAKIGGRNE